MYRTLKVLAVPCSAVLLLAADPSWKTKPADQWSEADGRQLLAQSPWVGKATPTLLAPINEARRREAGRMGGGRGAGVESLSASSLLGVGSQAPTHAPRPNSLNPLEIRWESATPVRSAEIASRQPDAPELASGFYTLAVYDVPGLEYGQRDLGNELKRDGHLVLDNKKDLRASRVEVLPQANGLTTVVYMFARRGAEITTADKRVTFSAMIGRLGVAQYFYLDQMRFRGKLEL